MDIVQKIKDRLHFEFSPHILEMVDESHMHGNSKPSHLRILIVSDAFEGLNKVQRHQRVYRTIGKDLIQEIHAFSQQTYTLTEWEKTGIRASSPPCHRKK